MRAMTMRRAILVSLAALASLASLLLTAACKDPPAPSITAPYRDDFERAAVGPDYVATADVYRIVGGQLNVSNAYNHPLWLRRKLPRNAVIELDVKSTSPAGDIKVEAWGDGRSHARHKGAYTSTGYVFIMGAWNNSKSILAKGNEHGADVQARTTPKVEPGRVYHWKIVKNGGRIEWFVDDMTTPFLAMDDPAPYEGPGHEHFGFNDWEADLWFDNLTITPLP